MLGKWNSRLHQRVPREEPTYIPRPPTKKAKLGTPPGLSLIEDDELDWDSESSEAI